ncbi:arp2/3 complex-activating protein rickA-like [Telopea speciosissima]|uniref:arp2/3 complex-activating protein rickA-like n=1 Tax=Telopea speciosissima TaxID=54955 RepID=UPI001CC4E674|nr:arp2/3 complex-activating protein rickA-like [Telopea speciosissima]
MDDQGKGKGMESSSSSSLELKVMSCNDLKAFNFFQKLSVYVVVSLVKVKDGNIKNEKEKQQRQKTPIDREGDRNPRWNHVMRFDLKGDYHPLLLLDVSSSDHDVFFEFDLRCEQIVFGNKTIGEVQVPIKDLMTGNSKEEEVTNSNSNSNGRTARFVSYQVRGPDGKPNGVLNFSYKIIHNNNVDASGKLLNNNDNQIGGTAASPLDLAYHPHGTHLSTGVELHYPSVEVEVQPPSLSSGVHYPSIEFEPPPPPPPPPQEAYYSAPEFYCTVYPAPPPPGMQLPYYYYPPPPPPPPLYPPPPPPPLYPPPPPHLLYPGPPVPYGYGSGSNGYEELRNDHSAMDGYY